ncbi:tail fiber domain-containing protein [Sphingomonas sp.]|uniref:tail fiber domain-containing protein n=1 Tax=Sphingomonas sp. TaxID=28214 RepID=UPI0031E3E386
MSWYRAGSVTVANGSSVVTGAGTDFVSNIFGGDAFIGPDGRSYEISQIVSATELRLVTTYQAASGGGQAYAIQPTQSYVRDLALQAGGLLNTFAAMRDGVGQGNFPDGSAAAPAIRFTADQDTGLWRVGDNRFGLVTGGALRALMDQSGNLGLGTAGATEATGRLHIQTAADVSNGLVTVASSLNGVAGLGSGWRWLWGAYTLGPTIRTCHGGDGSNAGLAFSRLQQGQEVEAMRLDRLGNVGIGTTAPAQKLHIYAGAIFNQTQAGAAYFYGGNADGQAGSRYSYMSLASATVAWGRVSDDLGTITEYGRFDQSGNFLPGSDNARSLGTGGMRFSVVYAGSGSINTSDARAKQQIGEVPDDWLDAWGDVQWVRYKFNDAVQAKGDEARWHLGLIAQQVRDAFAAHGLDALTLGLLCHDEWAAIPAIPAVEEERDEAGEIITPASPAQPGHEEGERWGLRYDECQAVEAAYQRRRIARLEEMVAALSEQHG